MVRYHTLLILIIIFALAFAYVEASVVVYLRVMYSISDLLMDFPTVPDQYTIIEIGREASTIIILAIIGWIAGKQKQDKIGYAIFAFGLWDIFYYGWLYIFIGWPKTLFDWDVLLLIPLPWWGPVLAPIIISVLLVISGYLATSFAEKGIFVKLSLFDWIIIFLCVILALYVFMNGSIHALLSGIDAVNKVRPNNFNWHLFLIAISGMVFVIVKLLFSKYFK